MQKRCAEDSFLFLGTYNLVDGKDTQRTDTNVSFQTDEYVNTLDSERRGEVFRLAYRPPSTLDPKTVKDFSWWEVNGRQGAFRGLACWPRQRRSKGTGQGRNAFRSSWLTCMSFAYTSDCDEIPGSLERRPLHHQALCLPHSPYWESLSNCSFQIMFFIIST